VRAAPDNQRRHAGIWKEVASALIPRGVTAHLGKLGSSVIPTQQTTQQAFHSRSLVPRSHQKARPIPVVAARAERANAQKRITTRSKHGIPKNRQGFVFSRIFAKLKNVRQPEHTSRDRKHKYFRKIVTI
jgi:hypothetical protein